jgi:hypothetical protein
MSHRLLETMDEAEMERYEDETSAGDIAQASAQIEAFQQRDRTLTEIARIKGQAKEWRARANRLKEYPALQQHCLKMAQNLEGKLL